MSGGPSRFPRHAGRWVTRSLAGLAMGWLGWTVVALGLDRLPPDSEPVRAVWDFVDPETPRWSSPNGRVSSGPQGLLLTPVGEPPLEPPMITSGPLDKTSENFGRVHLRLSLRAPAQGRVGLVLRTRAGVSHVVMPFEAKGGWAFEDIVVSLPVTSQSDARVVQVVVVPSEAPQAAVVMGIRAEPDEPMVITAVKELWSSSPGRSASLLGSTMSSFPPPVINGRSAWLVLIPAVLFAGTVARLARGPGALGHAIRRCAWVLMGTVWGVGFALGLYYQAVALAVDVESFGGRDWDEAYAVIDGAPLWHDMQDAATVLPPRSTVEFVADAGDDPVGSALWTGRARYYLYPVLVRSPAPVRIHYVGRPHRACMHMEPQREIVYEAERYCVSRAGS